MFLLFSREFHLDLKPSTSVFTENFRSTHNNGTEDPVDLSILYEGSVVGKMALGFTILEISHA